MRFQERDGEICLAIYRYGGVLARRHIREMFWPDATTLRAVQKRISKLVNHEYLARPTYQQRRTNPVPEAVYWLDWKAMYWLAITMGLDVPPPTNQNENQLRKFDRDLRKHGLHWQREPRWIQLPHDLKIIDFRMAVERSVADIGDLTLERWIHEGEFRSKGDTIAYKFRRRDGSVGQHTKKVLPDSYFEISGINRPGQESLSKLQFLLEMDRRTHPRDRFGREKVVPGLAFIKSTQFKAKFGGNAGRWLVVTTGFRRMRNLIERSNEVIGKHAQVFWFTFDDKLRVANVLTDPIWWQAGIEDSEPRPLVADS